MNIIIKPSSKPDKKYTAVIDNKKSILFGAIKENGKSYSDFTQHKDEDRKKRYLARHKKNEQWDNPLTASFYATNILWNKPTKGQWKIQWKIVLKKGQTIESGSFNLIVYKCKYFLLFYFIFSFNC